MYPSRSFLDRVFARERPAAADAALRTLLASRPLGELHRADVDRLFRNERVPDGDRQRICDRLWRLAFKTFLEDDEISGEEGEYLDTLRTLLQVSEGAVMQAEAEFAHPKLRALVERVLADHLATPAERAEMGRVATALRIPETLLSEFYRVPAQQVLQSRLREVLADRRVTPDELHALQSLGVALHVEITFNSETQRLLEKFALVWQLERGIGIPVIDAGIPLQAGEVCYAVAGAEWHELRSDRRYGETLTLLDTGTLVVTSARLLFDGQLRNRSLKYSAILGINQFVDGISIEKAAGRSPILKPAGDGDAEILGAIIRGAMWIAEARARP